MKKFGSFIFIITVIAALAVGVYAAGELGLLPSFSSAAIKTQEGESAKIPDSFSGKTIASISDAYDSLDEAAVVLTIDDEAKTVTLQNMQVDRSYTLDYSRATRILDRYGNALSMAQIKSGDVVEVTFLKSNKKLNTLALCSKDAWSVENTSEYRIDRNTKTMTIGKDAYRIEEKALLFSMGQRIDWMDIHSADVLTIHGIGQEIYSIIVEKGHGYLRLSGDEYFVGGWIEVGDGTICPITKDMLLTVPEGKHQVSVSKGVNSAVKTVEITRGKETVLDLSDVEIEQTKYGRILFSVTPGNAAVYVDGERVDISAPIELEYGVHQMIAGADGYDTMTRYIRVGEEMASLDIRLEKKKEATVSGNDAGASQQEQTGEKKEDTTTIDTRQESGYRVYVTGPEAVELYVDGTYIGLTPVDFAKEEGTHVITLRQNGFEPRSYTIQVDNEQKDISYSFAELETEKKP